MLKIYHVTGTRSVRAIWLCEELGVDYEIVPVDFSPEYRNSPEWRALNPTGKVPAMADGDTRMFESGAMVQYILDRYGDGRLEPAVDSPERARYLQWCWFAEATLARPLGDMVHHRVLKPEAERIPAMVDDGEKRARICLVALEEALQDRDYLCIEFSAADIMMGYSLGLAERMEILDGTYPTVVAYYKRLQHDHPAFVRAKTV